MIGYNSTTWPGMKQELQEYIRQCENSQKNRITQNKTMMQMKITTTSEVVWESALSVLWVPETNFGWKQIYANVSGLIF